MKTLYSFYPLINDQSKIIILGSMPGEESLKKNQYYGNPKNQFWKIIYTLFNTDPESEYEDRLLFLLKNKIALWDVIRTCNRKGSLDSDIKAEKVNDFEKLFNNYPAVERIYFNGKKAAEIYGRKIGSLLQNLDPAVLPSTSPAYTIGFDIKLENWKRIRDYL